MATFKLALDAGHGFNTPGRRCLKQYDPEEHREWWLNDRVCRYIQEAAKQYKGVEILRVDDTAGKTDAPLSERCRKANMWGASLYYSVHHNAGINGGRGGGVTAYSYQQGTKGAQWRDAFYQAIAEATGLKGNRATPKTAANFYVLRETEMPAVLIEHGFMDSPSDIPVIITEDFAKKAGYAVMSVIAARAGLQKAEAEVPKPADGYYRVQVGAFKNKAYAQELLEKLKKAGFQDAYIKG